MLYLKMYVKESGVSRIYVSQAFEEGQVKLVDGLPYEGGRRAMAEIKEAFEAQGVPVSCSLTREKFTGTFHREKEGGRIPLSGLVPGQHFDWADEKNVVWGYQDALTVVSIGGQNAVLDPKSMEVTLMGEWKHRLVYLLNKRV